MLKVHYTGRMKGLIDVGNYKYSYASNVENENFFIIKKVVAISLTRIIQIKF